MTYLSIKICDACEILFIRRKCSDPYICENPFVFHSFCPKQVLAVETVACGCLSLCYAIGLWYTTGRFTNAWLWTLFLASSCCNTGGSVLVGVHYMQMLGDFRSTRALACAIMIGVIWASLNVAIYQEWASSNVVFLSNLIIPFAFFCIMCWRVWRHSASLQLNRKERTDLRQQLRWLLLSAVSVLVLLFVPPPWPVTYTPGEIALMYFAWEQADVGIHAAQCFVGLARMVRA